LVALPRLMASVTCSCTRRSKGIQVTDSPRVALNTGSDLPIFSS
jgi:hypothetical protein